MKKRAVRNIIATNKVKKNKQWIEHWQKRQIGKKRHISCTKHIEVKVSTEKYWRNSAQDTDVTNGKTVGMQE